MVPRAGAVQIPKLLPRFECTPGPTPRGEAPPTRHHLEDSAHPPSPASPGGPAGPSHAWSLGAVAPTQKHRS